MPQSDFAYSLMGFAPEERENNRGLTMKAQRKQPKQVVVYETNSLDDAKAILVDGYITGAKGEHIVVTEIKMNNLTAGGDSISKSGSL